MHSYQEDIYSSFFVHSGNKVANRTMIYLHYGPEKTRNYTICEADEPKEEIDRNRGFNIYPRNYILINFNTRLYMKLLNYQIQEDIAVRI